jgi:hypothetical protein
LPLDRESDPEDVFLGSMSSTKNMKNFIQHTASKKRKVVFGEIVFKAGRDRASGQWIGVCDPIGLTVSGDTYSELVESINESVDAVFADLLISGDLAEFLEMRGWKVAEVNSPDGEEGGIDAPFQIETDNDPQAAIC